jgi:hypothetical protein
MNKKEKEKYFIHPISCLRANPHTTLLSLRAIEYPRTLKKVCHLCTCTCVRLLGPCFKTGRRVPSLPASGSTFSGMIEAQRYSLNRRTPVAGLHPTSNHIDTRAIIPPLRRKVRTHQHIGSHSRVCRRSPFDQLKTSRLVSQNKNKFTSRTQS